MSVAVDRKPVYYLALDRPQQVQRSFRRMVGAEHRRLLQERLVVHRGPLPIAVAKQPEALSRFVADVGAGTVVVDSLKDLGGDLREPKVGMAINQALQGLVAGEIEVVALHHMRKPQGEHRPQRLAASL